MLFGETAEFVRTAVRRQDLGASWPLVHPALKQGLSRKQWLTGAIPVVASVAGNPVPIDPVVGVFAAIFFLPPALIGYGIGRGLARLRARSRGTGGRRPG